MRSKQPVIPSLQQCKAYIETCGWTFVRRSIIRTYVFCKEDDRSHHCGEIAFTLRELRDAFRDGW